MRRLLPALLFALALLPGCKRNRAESGSGNEAKPNAPASGGNAKASGNPNPRGKLVIKVYDTLLELDLRGMNLEHGSFHIYGTGLTLVGPMSEKWEDDLGKPLRILGEVPTLGRSELDLPNVGLTPVTGELIMDEAVSRVPGRVKGRVKLHLPTPDQKVATFEGTFEVGILIR